MQRRYVFLLAKQGAEVIDGSTLEVRADSEESAAAGAAEAVRRWGCTTTLIGMREGFRSTQVFIPLVAIAELPEHIVQNEAIVARKVA